MMCRRFDPHCGPTRVKCAKRNTMKAAPRQSHTSVQPGGIWNEFVALFARDESDMNASSRRVLDANVNFNRVRSAAVRSSWPRTARGYAGT